MALSANGRPEERLRCFACGMNELLLKPVERSQLCEMVSHWCADEALGCQGVSCFKPSP